MSDGYQTIRLERSGVVALLTLSRPERLNAIDKRTLGELQHSLDAVERATRSARSPSWAGATFPASISRSR